MPGSAMSVAEPNVVINTIVAESLMQFADELEQATDFQSALQELIRRTIKKHKRIIFNGDGYSNEWKLEAARRGLLNLPTTADALPYFTSDANIELFTRHKVYTEKELRSRHDILLESYCKIITIEALTMCDMASRDIIPAVDSYILKLSQTIATLKSIDAPIPHHTSETLKRLIELSDEMSASLKRLLANSEHAQRNLNSRNCGVYCRDEVLPLMSELRRSADEAETITERSFWPFPTYGDLLYYN